MNNLIEICKEQTALLNECRQNIKELTEENEKLKGDINYQVNQKFEHFIETQKLKHEKEQLKEEVEHLKGIIQDEEDWKLLKSEEEWL